MNSFFRALIAGYGAKKLGGGCFSTILVFIVIYFALGQCNNASAKVQHPNTMETEFNALHDFNHLQQSSINSFIYQSK